MPLRLSVGSIKTFLIALLCFLNHFKHHRALGDSNETLRIPRWFVSAEDESLDEFELSEPINITGHSSEELTDLIANSMVDFMTINWRLAKKTRALWEERHFTDEDVDYDASIQSLVDYGNRFAEGTNVALAKVQSSLTDDQLDHLQLLADGVIKHENCAINLFYMLWLKQTKEVAEDEEHLERTMSTKNLLGHLLHRMADSHDEPVMFATEAFCTRDAVKERAPCIIYDILTDEDITEIKKACKQKSNYLTEEDITTL